MGEYMKRSEYISRDAAISKIRDQGVLGGDYDAYEREEDVVNTLKSIPVTAVVEVRHGRWKKSYADHEAFGVRPFFRYCSECHEATVHQYNYCPNCGAVMDGGQDE